MKKIKIISGGLNNTYAEIPATSMSTTGVVRSLKRDGTFIKGRHPFPEEQPLLWNFGLTTKEPYGKDTRLTATIYVPEEGVDVIDNVDKFKQMNGLYDHLMNHQSAYYFKVVDGKKVQANKNFRRNHLLSFEIIDESAQEEILFNNSRLETKYRAVIDELFDKDKDGDGAFIELCYGMGVVKPHQNTKRQNYNILVSMLHVNPRNFDIYWTDEDREMLNVISKGRKMDDPETGHPYITQNERVYYFKGNAIGTTDTELKLHFKQNEKEYDWLVRVTANTKKPVPAKVEIPEEEVTPKPYTPKESSIPPNVDATNKFKLGEVNRTVGMIMNSLVKSGDNPKKLEGVKERIEAYKSKNPNFSDHFEKRLAEEALKKGVAIPT